MSQRFWKELEKGLQFTVLIPIYVDVKTIITYFNSHPWNFVNGKSQGPTFITIFNDQILKEKFQEKNSTLRLS